MTRVAKIRIYEGGEAKTFFNQEAHIFYYLGKVYAAQAAMQTARNLDPYDFRISAFDRVC